LFGSDSAACVLAFEVFTPAAAPETFDPGL